jgi:ferric-dicitrate binding protein FerR (iron transport regulator)
MNIFERLIENPLFFKWIYHPSEEINFYWEHYLEVHPEQAPQIKKLKSQFEEHLKFRQEKLSDSEKKALAKKILFQLNRTERKKKHRLFIQASMRYAAVALLFFAIGSGLVYLYMESRQSEVFVDNTGLPAQVQEPVLIIGNKEQVKLNQGKSELEYSSEGDVRINHETTFPNQNDDVIPEMNTLVIPYGSRSEIVLSDGTKVWLNAGSRLIYPSRFVDKDREVLLSGEAFFSVKENSNQPFVVKTADVKVEVLGTKFNVSAYPEDYSVQTVLTEGSVKIRKSEAGLFNKATKLEPGQMAYFNKKSEEATIYEVDTKQYTSWTQGLWNFSNTDFNRIVKRLERYYNIRFQFDDPMKGTIQITGKLDVTQDQEEVFEYLSKITGLHFIKINNRQYVIQ